GGPGGGPGVHGGGAGGGVAPARRDGRRARQPLCYRRGGARPARAGGGATRRGRPRRTSRGAVGLRARADRNGLRLRGPGQRLGGRGASRLHRAHEPAGAARPARRDAPQRRPHHRLRLLVQDLRRSADRHGRRGAAVRRLPGPGASVEGLRREATRAVHGGPRP
ncbi:MAG: hypothetical protein AVDCRST_MAG88-2668, partial [uncultured Thermomicrobiales bacterium]